MTSNKKDRDEGIDLSALVSEADRNKSQTTEKRLKALEDRLAAMEENDEGKQKLASFAVELEEYVKELRTELKYVQRIRLVAVILAIAVVVLLMSVLTCLVFFERQLLFILNSNAFPAIAVSAVAGPVILLAGLLKGSFRTISDRHKDDPMPESIKPLAEAISPFVPRGE